MNKWFLTLSGAVSAAVIAVALVLVATQSPSPAKPPAKAQAQAPAQAQTQVEPSTLVQVPAFGANPSGLVMNIYVPHSLRPDPAILLALHWGCATGPDFYQATGFSALADEYGFIVIYPTSPGFAGCFDTASFAALKHGGGSDPTGLVSMITYTERKYHANPHRVYVTGASAGGMMAADMLGDYPDVFAGGAIFEATPFGCPQSCAGYPAAQTPQQWGAIVRNAYPGYHGPRPRVQLWHGTVDQNVSYANFGQEIRQWTDVLGVSQTPLETAHPQPGWTRTDYGTGTSGVEVQAYSLSGVGHYLPEVGMEAYVIRFFGLDHP